MFKLSLSETDFFFTIFRYNLPYHYLKVIKFILKREREDEIFISIYTVTISYKELTYQYMNCEVMF